MWSQEACCGLSQNFSKFCQCPKKQVFLSVSQKTSNKYFGGGNHCEREEEQKESENLI